MKTPKKLGSGKVVRFFDHAFLTVGIVLGAILLISISYQWAFGKHIEIDGSSVSAAYTFNADTLPADIQQLPEGYSVIEGTLSFTNCVPLADLVKTSTTVCYDGVRAIQQEQFSRSTYASGGESSTDHIWYKTGEESQTGAQLQINDVPIPDNWYDENADLFQDLWEVSSTTYPHPDNPDDENQRVKIEQLVLNEGLIVVKTSKTTEAEGEIRDTAVEFVDFSPHGTAENYKVATAEGKTWRMILLFVSILAVGVGAISFIIYTIRKSR